MQPLSDVTAVSLVLVSYGKSVFAGLAELVGQVAGPTVPIYTVGGAIDGSLGTDGERVLAQPNQALGFLARRNRTVPKHGRLATPGIMTRR
jgi:hypothetical protein